MDNLSQIFVDGHPVFFRDGTSDAFLIQKNIIGPPNEREYALPSFIKPKVILDIGANIGVISLLLNHLYPEAKIFAFEPEKENYQLLQANVRPFSNIIPVNYGLGANTLDLPLYKSDENKNFGGFSLYNSGSKEFHSTIQIKSVKESFLELSISQIDLIKIDCEGAEYAILTAMRDFIPNVKWIEGELHGENDFRLLNYLTNWFDVGVKKNIGEKNYPFQAKNKLISL